ncbi:MAG: DNRLRE domain-containing protein [Opitutaceae bacterium]|jgi:hypothetical protein
MKKSIYLLLALGFMQTLAAAQTVVAVSQDSFVKDGASADTVFTTSLEVGNRGSGFNRKSYLEIDINSIIPANQKIGTAALKLTVAAFAPGTSTEDSTFNVYGIIDNADAWNQSTLTWNNAPKNDTASSNGISSTGTVLLGSITFNPAAVDVNGSISFSSAALADYLNWAAGLNGNFYSNGITSDTDKKITLILTSVSATSPAVTVYSTEGTTIPARDPQLEVTFTSSIPESSTFALMVGLGALVCVSVRRRR